MTVDQVVALIGAVTALLVALGAILAQLHQLRKDLNGRLTELVAVTAKASLAEGVIQGRRASDRQKGPVPPLSGDTGPDASE